MNVNVLSKKSSYEVRAFFTKEYEMLLISILTKLGIEISFPTELEELILKIPEEKYIFNECQKAYYMINENIKSHIEDLIEIYQKLLKFEKDLSCKR